MRMKFDYSNVDIADVNMRNHIEAVFDASAKFFHNLLEVDQVNIRAIDFSSVDINTPQAHIDNDIPDCDVMIYVRSLINKEENFVANAASILKPAANKRPYFGKVQLNMQYFSYEHTPENPLHIHEQFEYNLETIIHEIFHILGLNGSSLDNFVDYTPAQAYETGNKMIDGVSVTYKKIKTPTVVAFGQQYFCGDKTPPQCEITYIPFENEGGDGSKGSHWERMMLQNDFMTASVISSDAAISQFSLAFLKDSGWYHEVNLNMAEDCIQWGRNKGPGFLESTDCRGPGGEEYWEFYPEQKEDSCDFHHFGYGPSKIARFSNNCYITSIYTNGDCTKPQYQSTNTNTFELNGIHSKCFQSSIQSSTYNTKCYQYYCVYNEANDSNEVVIQFMKDGKQATSLTCTENGQQLDAPGGMSGSLSCPHDLNQFCGLPVPCPNYCSSKGYCLRQSQNPLKKHSPMISKCHCIDGYAGEDCSKELTGSCQNKFLIQGTTDDCHTTCPAGYTQEPRINLCVLDTCNSACSDSGKTCDGTTENDCKKCSEVGNPDEQYYFKGKCYYNCPEGYISTDGYSCRQCTNTGQGQECLNFQSSDIKEKEAVVNYEGDEKYVCSQGFNENSAQVFCKNKGYGTYKSYKEADCKNDLGFWISSLACQGTETTIADCQKQFTTTCYSNKCIQIECDTETHGDTIANNSIKEEKNLSNALLAFTTQDGWGGICSTTAGQSEATVLCKQLGYDRATKVNPGARCPSKVVIQTLQCSGDEENIKDCTTSNTGECQSSHCLNVECVKSDIAGELQGQAKDLIKGIDAKLDGIYKVLAYLFGAALVMVISICILSRCCGGNEPYVVVIDKKMDDPTGPDGEFNDYYTGAEN